MKDLFMDPYHFGKLYPDPHQSGKPDPDPHQKEKQDPDSHQSEKQFGSASSVKVKPLFGHFWALEGPNLGKSEW